MMFARATRSVASVRVSDRLQKALARITLLLAGLFALLAVGIWIFQERIAFLPPAVPTVQGRGSAKLEYVAVDGQPLFGFLVETRDSVSGAIVVFHGNGDLADSWVDWARAASARTGWPVFLAEYRGYGGLSGRPTYAGALNDARAAVDLISTRYRLRSDQIILYGHSLGSGIAAKLAAERQMRAIVLEAPMTSFVDMGRRAFGPPISWMLPLVSRSPFSPIREVGALRTPVWVAVGGRDEVVPPEMGRAVFAAAANKGELLYVATADHGSISDSGGEAYWEWLSRAVR